MIQTGKVVEIVDNKRAKLLMRKHSACGDCGACQHGQENMKLNIIAVNEVNAKVGNTVEVDMETKNILGAAFIVYVIPLIALLVGVGGGSFLFNKMGFTSNAEMYSLTLGVVLMIVMFLGIKMKEKSFKKDKRYMPMITKILEQ